MNEFVVKNGLISKGGVYAIGAITSSTFLGDLQGSASYATSASWAPMPDIPSTDSASWASASLSSSAALYANTAGVASTVTNAPQIISASHASSSVSSSHALWADGAANASNANSATVAGYSATALSASWASSSISASHAVNSYLAVAAVTATTATSASTAALANYAFGPVTESNGALYYGLERITMGTPRNDPTGFANGFAVTMSYDVNRKAFQLTQSNAYVYSAGKEYIKQSEEIILTTITTGSLAHIYYAPDTLALSYFTAGTWDISSAAVPVATVYFDGTNAIIGRETHGIQMDGATQEYLHETFGPRYASGYPLTHTGSDARFIVGAGHFYDDDVGYYDQELTQCRIIWHSGSNLMVTTPLQDRLWVTASGTSLIAYDNLTTTASVAANRYVAYWLFGVNGYSTRLISVMGQRTDTTLDNARANNTPASLTYGTFPLDEAKVFYRLIYNGNGVLQDTTDFRQSLQSGGSYTATDHGTLTGLNDDDHLQYLNLNGRTGGQNVVGGITASLQGTASNAVLAETASFLTRNRTYEITASVAVTASNATYAVTAATATNATSASIAVTSVTSVNAATASYVSQSITFPTATNGYFPYFFNNTLALTSFISQSANEITIFAPLIGSASYANNSLSASYAANVPNTASYALQALNAVSASYAANVPSTASYAMQALSASYAPSSPSVSASYAATASLLRGPFVANSAGANIIDLDGSHFYNISGGEVMNFSTQELKRAGFAWRMEGTSSWATTSSYGLTARSASSALYSDTAGTATIANAISFVPYAAVSASWVSASVKITTADTASYVQAANIAGTLTAAQAPSASYLTSSGVVVANGYTVGTGWQSISTAASYTISEADNGRQIVINSGSNVAVTLTTASISPTFTATFYQSGSGKLIFSATGVPLRNRSGFTGSAGQFAIVSVTRIQGGEYVLVGDLA